MMTEWYLSCLPDELKLHIISFLPIHKLITEKPLPIFHEHIMHYINTQLLKDMYIAGLLYRKDMYNNILYEKVNDIAGKMTHTFMKETERIGGPITYSGNSTKIISLRILFTFTKVGRRFNGPTDDYEYSLSTNGLQQNYCTWMTRQFQCGIKYNEKSIQCEILRILIKNMDCCDTTINIKKMELVEADIFNDRDNIILVRFI